MEGGEIINGLKSKTWIERYRDMSEFTLVADLSSGVREKLPLGSFISHVDTWELMIVENHEISDSNDAEPQVIISGRSFESILENRIVRSNLTPPVLYGVFDYILASNYTWNQIAHLAQSFIRFPYDPNDAVEWVDCTNMVPSPWSGVQVQRQIEKGNLYERIQELMDIDNLGLKTLRPGRPNAYGIFFFKEESSIGPHKGVDKTATVTFSHDSGEIESADYLWSGKDYKNSAYISGRWVATAVSLAGAGNLNYGRRMIWVDGSSIDSNFETSPTGSDLTNVIDLMQQRGWAAIAKRNNVSIANVEINKQLTRYKYRKDYDIGDIVGVHGNFDTYKRMRVIEHVEIEDENGEQSYPTLADPTSV